MGVKSTVHLTRSEAIQKYADLKMRDKTIRRRFEAEATALDTEELENVLEHLNDVNSCNGEEGFENYSIRD